MQASNVCVCFLMSTITLEGKQLTPQFADAKTEAWRSEFARPRSEQVLANYLLKIKNLTFRDPSFVLSNEMCFGNCTWVSKLAKSKI